jgi:enolase
MATTISRVHGREVIDSRGNPTLEVELALSDGTLGRAIVPSGASTGAHEALELRDGDKKRFLGKGVLKAVHNVNDVLGPALVGKTAGERDGVDRFLLSQDPSAQKSKLGGNTLLGISLAYANAVALHQKRPLFLLLNEWIGKTPADLRMPVPLMNIVNGGMHADNGLAIQEFMIVPHGFETFSEALRAGCEVFHHLKTGLHDKHLSTGVGDEGGFAPALKDNESALEFICSAIEKAGYRLGSQVSLALDCAASSFYSQATQKYRLSYRGKAEIDSTELVEFYAGLADRFPIVSIEDGLDEDDWDGWKRLTAQFSPRLQLVGDDIFVTQTARVRRGIENKVANAVLIKVNQVGTLVETLETMNLATQSGYRCVVSHRSGETEDVTIAHLAVGSGCGQIKTGSASRSERLAKYNELLRIEEWAKSRKTPIAFGKVR